MRKAGYDETMRQIRKGLTRAGRPEIALAGVEWGDDLGVNVGADALDAVLPKTKTRALSGADDAEWEAALWRQLALDPWFELRLAAMRASAPGDAPAAVNVLPGGETPPDQALLDSLQRARATVVDPLPGEVEASAIRAAIDELLNDPGLLRQAAIGARSAVDVDLVRATARAVVALALSAARGQIGEGPDALFVIEDRRLLVEALVVLLAPLTKDVGSWLFGVVKDFALGQATSYGKARRHDLMTGISPGVGDILLYQRRGQAILEAIETKIVELSAKGPVVVLGHSLGGIMLVDLLSRRRQTALPVARLITVASQSPMFFKCDALESMRLGQTLDPGAPFRPWLNVFDRNDFLSFCADRAFGSLADIEDFEIRSGVAFPDSHGAYFRLPALYNKIVSVWP